MNTLHVHHYDYRIKEGNYEFEINIDLEINQGKYFIYDKYYDMLSILV